MTFLLLYFFYMTTDKNCQLRKKVKKIIYTLDLIPREDFPIARWNTRLLHPSNQDQEKIAGINIIPIFPIFPTDCNSAEGNIRNIIGL